MASSGDDFEMAFRPYHLDLIQRLIRQVIQKHIANGCCFDEPEDVVEAQILDDLYTTIRQEVSDILRRREKECAPKAA